MVKPTTFNQDKHAYFLKLLVSKLVKKKPEINKRRLVLVVDSCKFHRIKKIQEILLKREIIWLFIPPYSPEANTCKKLIKFIKSYAKTQPGQ